MFRGVATTKLFEDCIASGLCTDHLKELQVEDESQRHELQRKTLLYIRLQIVRPILFDKPFTSEKIKTLLDEAGYFNINKKSFVSHEEFIEQVLTLDSVVVFTLVKLCNMCCAGALFRTGHRACIDNTFLKLLTQKTIEAKDIAYFAPILNANFSEYDEGLIKISYVAVLLYVRNVAMHLNLKQILDQQELGFKSLSNEGAQWNDIGSEAFKRKCWEEAIDAFTKAVDFSPYCVSLLLNRAQTYMKLDKFKDAALDCYIAWMIKPTHFPIYSKWATVLYIQSQFSECVELADYGLNMIKNVETDETKYKTLEKIKIEATNALEQKKAESAMHVSSPPEKKDLPELVEASDSETECQDVPELMDASNSDDSDSDTEWATCETAGQTSPSESSVNQQINSEQIKAEETALKPARDKSSSVSDNAEEKMDHQINSENCKEKDSMTKTTKVKKSSIPEVSHQKDNSEEQINMLQISLKDASNTLLDGCGLMAMRRFRDALDEIKASPEIYKYEDCDIMCIKYAYAFACYQSGGYDDLQKAISVLQEVTEEQKNITFPAAYYTIGLSYRKLNRFKQALQYFKMVDDILEKGIHSKVYVWPGLTTVITETKLEFLKTSLPALIKECENPPPADGTCRYEGCTLQPSIYYTDPDFKGFFTINCSEQCNLQYHPQCWKSIKIAKNYSDKLFLEHTCFTPDCVGIIIKIQSINKEGNVAKEFIHADGKKSTKTKKSKLEKKLEIKEEKRRKRKDSSSRTESTSEVPEELASAKPNEPESVSIANEPEINSKLETIKDNSGNPNGSNAPQLPVNAEPVIVLKKEKFTQETHNKAATKVKEQKKVKSNTYSIDEFLQDTDAPLYGNDYQQRLNTLRLNNESLADGIWSKSSINNTQSVGANYSMDNFKLHSSSVNSLDNFEGTKIDENGLDDFPDIQPIDISEYLKEKIYNYFREMLGRCGPMRVDDPGLLEKINNFPEDAKIIADSGGIGKFLQQNLEFAFVNDTYICLVEQIPVAYRKNNEAPLPVHDTDLKLSDNYENFGLGNKNSTEIFRFSGLNPDARDFNPETSTNRSSRHHSGNSVAEMDKLDFLPESLSKLKINSDNAFKNDELNAVSNVESSAKQMSAEGMDHSRKSSISSTASCSQNLFDADSHSGNKVTELVNTFKELIRMYHTQEMVEHKHYIDVCLKPYTISYVPKKYARSIQTEEIEKVSRGTMKTDDEILEQKDMISQLMQEKRILEEEYMAAIEYATKFQNKSTVEMALLKKELEDKIVNLAIVEKEFIGKEAKLGKDIKSLTEDLKKTKAENAAQKKEMEKLITVKESLLQDRALLEEKVFSLQQEEQKLREGINEDDKLKDRVMKLEMEKNEADKRAKSAELLLLHLKKTEFLKRIDIKKGEAAKKIKEIHDATAAYAAHLSPLYIKSIEKLMTLIRNYIELLEDIKTKFAASIDEQINEVNNGVPLAKLKPLEVQELPDIPSCRFDDKQMGSMFNPQSSWRPPQMGNSVFNTGTFHPFSYASTNPLNLMNNIQGSQISHEDPKLQTPLQNGSYNVSNDSIGQTSKMSSVPPATKAPPGIQSTTTTASLHAPATSMVNLPSSLAQSIVNGEAKPKGASNNNIPAAVSSASDERVPFAYAASYVVPNSAIISSEKIASASSSLELDYKVKPVENPKPLLNNPTSQTTSSESKKTGDKGAKKSFEKLLSKLQERFPNYSHTELMECVKEFRTKRGSGLSGLSLDTVINSVGEIIEAKTRNAIAQVKLPDPVIKPKMMPNAVLVNKKLVPEPKTKEQSSAKETSVPKKSVWGVSDSENSKQWNGSEIEEDCVICHEEMNKKTAYKVDCGHHFHFKCIKEWLDKKSDCPICRVHLLLPEDYPALS